MRVRYDHNARNLVIAHTFASIERNGKWKEDPLSYEINSDQETREQC